MSEKPTIPYSKSKILQREAGGSEEVWQRLVERETLIDEIVARGGAANAPDELFGDLARSRERVELTKQLHGIEQPDPTLPVDTIE